MDGKVMKNVLEVLTKIVVQGVVCRCEGNWIPDGADQADRNTVSQEAVGE